MPSFTPKKKMMKGLTGGGQSKRNVVGGTVHRKWEILKLPVADGVSEGKVLTGSSWRWARVHFALGMGLRGGEVVVRR